VAGDYGGKTNKCAGTSQTPINLVAATIDPALTPPEFMVTSGGCDKWVQFGDDHAFEVSFSETDMACTNLQLKYKGTTYTLLQFHFHAPAEHAIASGLGAAELHMVHKSSDGKLLVLGVIMASNGIVAGGGNQFLKKFWDVAYDGYAGISSTSACSTLTAFATTGTTTSGSTTITFGSTIASTLPSVGDTVVDTSGACFTSGATVVSTTSTTVVMSIAASDTCSATQFSYVTSSNLITKTCDPALSVMAKEYNVYAQYGSNIMSGQCKYALEYDAEEQVSKQTAQSVLNAHFSSTPPPYTLYITCIYKYRQRSTRTSSSCLPTSHSTPTRAR